MFNTGNLVCTDFNEISKLCYSFHMMKTRGHPLVYSNYQRIQPTYNVIFFLVLFNELL